MITRFLNPKELQLVFDKNEIPKDLLSSTVVGVFETADCAMLIENCKLGNRLHSDLNQGYSNLQSLHDRGLAWMIQLEAEKLSQLLTDEDFFSEHCGKAGNPYELSKRMALYVTENYTYWTDNVYTEAFED